MECFLELVEEWGYLAVFLGSLIEGESVILLASALAWLGYFSILKVMVVAFCGTVVADQGLFHLGHYFGPTVIQRFPRFQHPAERAFALLKRWGTTYILIFRFIYGVRIISPVVIGASGYDPKRFVPLNILAAVIWTVISCMGGYLLGYCFGELVRDFIMENATAITRYSFLIVLSVLAVIFVVFWSIHLIKKRCARKRSYEVLQSSDP